MMQDPVPPDLMMAFPSESELPDLFHLFLFLQCAEASVEGYPDSRFPFLKCLLGHCSECPLRCPERFFREIKKKSNILKHARFNSTCYHDSQAISLWLCPGWGGGGGWMVTGKIESCINH